MSLESGTGRPTDRSSLIERFKRLADKPKVLGFNEQLFLDKYPNSPILDALWSSAAQSGGVSIAYVPSGMGKTTAAMRVLQKHWNKFHGIAICGGNYQDGQPFIIHMLKLLDLDQENPPDGWMHCLVDGLMGPLEDKRQALLMLDEVCCPPDNQHPDSQLLSAMRNRVKNTGIHVVVLTPDEECANHLSGSNSLVAIGPMLHVYSSPDDFPQGHWLSMRFTVPMLRIACMNNPALLKKAINKDKIGAKFDLLVQTNADGYLDDKAPETVIDILLQTFADEQGVTDLTLAASTNREVADVDQNGCLAGIRDVCTIS